MKKLAILMVLALSSLSTLLAQNATPAPTAEPNQDIHFRVSTDYWKLTDGAQATVISACLPVSDRFSACYDQVQAPSFKAQIYLGGVEFREKLSHLLKNPGTSQVNLDKVQIFVRASLGTKRDDLNTHPQLAWGVFGGADVPLGTLAGATTLLEFKAGYIGVPKDGLGIALGSSPVIAGGPVIRF